MSKWKLRKVQCREIEKQDVGCVNVDHLPTWSFSPRMAQPTIATTTSSSGLNMDTYSGPRTWMHQDMSANAMPDPTTPCACDALILSLLLIQNVLAANN
jgi:hypothetical protein